MKFSLPKDQFNNFTPPRLFLCTTSGKRIGELPSYDTSLNCKWNAYSELTFTFDRRYVDVLTGETVTNPLFDKAEGLRLVEVENIGMFIIQDPDTSYSDKDSKSLSCFSLEYSTASKYIENFYVNNGAEESIEVTYEASKYGANATKDDMYKMARYDDYDASEQYFHREYRDSINYTYEPIQIVDENAYKTHFGNDIPAENILYIHGYANVQFYDPHTPQLSLLHNIFEKIPEWHIGNVDYSLWHKERKIEESRISVYDLLTNKVADIFECVVIWDTLNRTVDFRLEENDGLTEDGVINTDWETDVYISRENLASQMSVKYSTDDIKTKLKVSGADDLTIREVNLGKNYIMNLDFYHTPEWMEPDLFEVYDEYLNAVEENKQPYEEAVQGWVAAYNQWNELQNAVPAEGNVVLVGDEFKKLYCIYTPIDNAYLYIAVTDSNIIGNTVSDLYSDSKCTEVIDKTHLSDGDMFVVQGYRFIYKSDTQNYKCELNEIINNIPTLIDKLNLYHVDEDLEGNKVDNVFLTLKNSDSDTATIRIYDPKVSVATADYDPNAQYYTRAETYTGSGKYKYTKDNAVNASNFDSLKSQLYTNNYKIQCIIIRSTSGLEDIQEYDISSWIKGRLNVDDGMNNLSGFKISSIGTMGAYFVLAKDETQEENIVDYGIELLREKRDIYTKIFQTQTEAMWSQEKYQCIASKIEPTGNVPEGTRWFKTDDAILYKRTNALSSESFSNRWVSVKADANAADLENYQRYIDNYEKLQTVQTVLNEKEREAQYYLDGYAVSDIKIDVNEYDDTYHTPSGQSLEASMERVAKYHFSVDENSQKTITRADMDNKFPLYLFECSDYPGEFALANTYEQNVVYYTNKAGLIANPQPTQENFNQSTYYKKIKDIIFAVYLKGTTPYVAYAESEGVYQMKMNYYSNLTEMKNFFNEDQWVRLSPFIREDEYSNDNVLLNGLESEEERLSIYKELVELASKELKTLSQPSLEFSMDMSNIMAIPEFEPLMSQFALGNFIRIELRPELVKRARLLEVNLNFDDLSDFSCTFGNLVTTKDQVDLHAELLSQAISAGKQVAASAGEWQKSVDKTNQLEKAINDGLQDCAIHIGKASGQAISWDHTGMHFRKYKDGSDSEYEPEEMAIINNSLVATNDSWRTSKSAFGKYVINGEERWGPIAEYVTADTIEGKFISGGSLRIGGKEGDKGTFIVNEDGSVQILGPNNQEMYAGKALENAYRFQTRLTYDGLTIFTDINHKCTITCHVYDTNKPIGDNGMQDQEVTAEVIDSGGMFTWNRSLSGSSSDWTPTFVDNKPNVILIKHTDIERNAQFDCVVDFDETKFNE